MNPQPKKNNPQLESTIISIEQAQAETKEWREVFVNKFGGNVNLIKAFFIPMQDMSDLINNYKQHSPTGVRAYLGYTATEKGTESPIRLILVPATETEDFYNVGTGINNDTGSSVYDFTRPCPDCCAAENPLNSDIQFQNVAEKK